MPPSGDVNSPYKSKLTHYRQSSPYITFGY